MGEVRIYIETEYNGNPACGKGKYYVVLETTCSNGEIATREIIGGVKETTKNRLAIIAINKALERFTKESEIVIYCNNSYVMETLDQGRYITWIENGWRVRNKEIKNKDLWLRFVELAQEHNIIPQLVRTHAYTAVLRTMLDKAIVEYEEDKKED
ncbi:RNase H family protein [Lachnoclostridium phytofermentans]|uniref:RNase H family protein n=1 Tax=Lachnoclostridium phytofermentans TaxID=66219 RepID=UPI000496F491|nr:RNase H family protein [Lachnoclostridium phytofermentans]